MKTGGTHEVTPHEWMMPNRQGFPQWMHNTFDLNTYESKQNEAFFPHQRLIRDFMQFSSPYRGMLLFHGLGVGKTCASIAAAEGFIQHGRKIIVMVPASLATNYRQEIMKCASVGNASAMIWNQVEVQQMKRKAVATKLEWIPGPVEEAKKYGKVVRKNVAWSKLKLEEQEEAKVTLDRMMDEHFTFVNYNGLTLKAWNELTKGDGATFFNDAFVVMDEAHNFMSRVTNGGKVAVRMYQDMINAKSMRIVLLTGTPVINHPYELCLLLNMVRGMTPMHTITFNGKKGALPSENDVRKAAGDISKYIDHISITTDTRKLHFTLCPENFRLNEDFMLVPEVWSKSDTEIVATFLKLISDAFSTGSEIHTSDVYALPTSKDEFMKTYIDDSEPEKPKVKNMDMFMRRILGLVSYVRTTGEENFPRVTNRHNEAVEMSDFQFRTYNKVRGTERNLEKKQKQRNRMSRDTGLFGSTGTVYRAFSRMACNFVFPDDIERKYPMDLRNELQRVLDKEMDISKEDVAMEEKDKDDSSDKEKEKEKKLAKDYEANIKYVMKQLKEQSASILTPQQLNNIYSPKIARVLEHIQSSPGKNLVYSQFRSVEGLGVVQLALEEAGYVRVELSKKGQSWNIVNAKDVLSPTFTKKRYFVFDGDRDKIKMLLHMFNGEFDALPSELQSQLKTLIGKDKKPLANVYGELINTIMITQSGAEGISLKNVRRVMILEPFWNMVRMDQVIGRAVRNNSHIELPQEERTVEVFIYTTIFTKQQLDRDFTLRNLDDGLTSDSHILRIAQNKDEIIQTFLNHMKMAALDCRNHSNKNKLMQQGIRCYAFPIPVDPSKEAFIPDAARDALYKSRMVRTRKIQGKVVTYRGVKYVAIEEYPNKLFNYSAYKDSGVLEEVSI